MTRMLKRISGISARGRSFFAAFAFCGFVVIAAVEPKASTEEPFTSKKLSVSLSEIVGETTFLLETESAAEDLPAPILETEEELKESKDSKDSIVKLNMAARFPDGANQSDVWNSYAGILYKELITKDSQWLSELYSHSTEKPETLARELGVYTETEEDSIAAIAKFEKTYYKFTDGNGTTLSAYSNAKEILTMASIYAYCQKENQAEKMEAYAKDLWKKSHHASIEIGNVYYCSGELDGERDESEPEGEDPAKSPAETAEGSAADSVAYSDADSIVDETVESRAETAEDMAEVSTGVSASPSDAQLPEEITRQLEGITGPGRAEMAKKLLESHAAIQAESQDLDIETSSPESEKEGCQGHVDLTVTVTLSGFEGKNGLFAIDSVERLSENGTWHGWDEYNQAYAGYLYGTDWTERYGLFPSDIAVINPLTASEITRYMNKMPEDISEERKEIVEYALSSVGRIPYYWGGKANGPGYDVNSFGVSITPDYKGRSLKGLDCSGWINWVYWSATGERFSASSTNSLASAGRAVAKEDLQPGDIMVRTSTTDASHVVMFLGWTADGTMECVHESSTGTGNVIISIKEANGYSYRNLLD